ncbi:MAG: orotidine-5'-phosphate decarboxylase [Bacteroidetes bacterium]|nr:orotidine-5'-phosphate decarboxylase [Bacteroidota bacterium]
MNNQILTGQILEKKSFLCVGLDTDSSQLPPSLIGKPKAVFQFNKAIIDATYTHTVAYKINTAFYECDGIAGWQAMEQTAQYIHQHHPNIFLIADAKRGDIGNTSRMYAKAFLQNMPFHAITVAPYMGSDSIQPFLQVEHKYVIVLGLTSNQGSNDFQHLTLTNDKPLYQQVIETVAGYGTPHNTMFVIGATQAQNLQHIRSIIPHHFLLVPGVGAQGGRLADVITYGANEHGGLLINASRSIIYASKHDDFAQAAAIEAASMVAQMAPHFAR